MSTPTHSFRPVTTDQPQTLCAVCLRKPHQDRAECREETDNQHLARVANSVTSLTVKENRSVSISSFQKDVPPSTTARIIDAPVAVRTSTVQLNAVADRQTKPATPSLIAGWQVFMVKHDPVDEYPSVLSTIQQGAVIGVPLIRHSLHHLINPIDYYSELFLAIIHHEYATGQLRDQHTNRRITLPAAVPRT
jgi:hypothetical protein